MSEVTSPQANLGLPNNSTATPSTLRGVMKSLPGISFLDTPNSENINVSWDNIEETQDITFYDILVGPAFRCNDQELMYFDKFSLSRFCNIESFGILWNIEHSHHRFLRDK